MNENGEYRPNESNQADNQKQSRNARMLACCCTRAMNLGHSAYGCVSCRITVIDEAICKVLYILRKRSIETRDVRDQHRLVVLSAPCEHRGHEGNAEASTLIAEKVGEARRFVVFVLGQIGVGELAGRTNKKAIPNP